MDPGIQLYRPGRSLEGPGGDGTGVWVLGGGTRRKIETTQKYKSTRDWTGRDHFGRHNVRLEESADFHLIPMGAARTSTPTLYPRPSMGLHGIY